jgi:hypothetical protein
MAQLSEEEQAALLLAYRERHRQDEVSNILHCSPRKVSTILPRARKHLAEVSTAWTYSKRSRTSAERVTSGLTAIHPEPAEPTCSLSHGGFSTFVLALPLTNVRTANYDQWEPRDWSGL